MLFRGSIFVKDVFVIIISLQVFIYYSLLKDSLPSKTSNFFFYTCRLCIFMTSPVMFSSAHLRLH